MRSLVIWNQYGGLPALFLVDGDLRRFENVTTDHSDVSLVCDMMHTMYDEITGFLRTDGLLTPEWLSALHKGESKLQFNYIVRCGIAP